MAQLHTLDINNPACLTNQAPCMIEYLEMQILTCSHCSRGEGAGRTSACSSYQSDLVVSTTDHSADQESSFLWPPG